MLPEPAITMRHVSKCYRIYDKPSDRLKQMLLLGHKNYFREFWALNDVSFDIRPGETVGIIGRNGAGKSTLLQMLCGTLMPTGGDITVNGRVAALLELGSGFNPEFTGRENVYMNAGILGLTRRQVDDRFEQIVAFADIGDHLDQPVKTYSSGMYVRLAFAVVVHVDADILIVDEALAVGDMYFQAKCMAHMRELMESGVTVLFVSHDIGAVKALCARAIYLEDGEVARVGNVDEVVEAYYAAGARKNQVSLEVRQDATTERPAHFCDTISQPDPVFAKRAEFQRLQNGMADFLNVILLDHTGAPIEMATFGQEVTLRMTVRTNLPLHVIGAAYHIRDKNGFDVIYSDTEIERTILRDLAQGEFIRIDWRFKTNLKSGTYTIATMLSVPQDLTIGKVEICDFVPLAVNFEVIYGKHLPIYGAAYWPNILTVSRSCGANIPSRGAIL